MITRAMLAAYGWSLAVGAWAFALATYPLVVCYAYAIRDAAEAFEQSLEDLHDSWATREDAA